jgi:hypothetical protein
MKEDEFSEKTEKGERETVKALWSVGARRNARRARRDCSRLRRHDHGGRMRWGLGPVKVRAWPKSSRARTRCALGLLRGVRAPVRSRPGLGVMVMVASATAKSYVTVVLGWLKEHGGEADMSRHHAIVHGSVPALAVWPWCACVPRARNAFASSSSLDGVAVGMATCTNNREVWLPRQRARGAVPEPDGHMCVRERGSSYECSRRPWFCGRNEQSRS